MADKPGRDPTPEAAPIHDWEKEELDRRKERLQCDPGSALTWEEVAERVRRRDGI